MLVFGIDPSTNKTGAALVRFEKAGGLMSLLWFAEIDAPSLLKKRGQRVPKDALTARFARLNLTAASLQDQADSQRIAREGFDLVAFEMPFMRGQAASHAIAQASGAYVALPAFRGVPVVQINTSAVKAVFGNARAAFRQNVSPAAKAEKREIAKAQNVEWVNRAFNMNFDPHEDAVADAIGVCIAGYNLYREREREEAVKMLRGLTIKTSTRKAKG